MNTVSLPQISTTSKRATESAVPAAKESSSDESNGLKLPKAPSGFFNAKTQWDNTANHLPGRMISQDWQSRATTTHRSKRKVTFTFQDDRFESLMLYLSPVLDKQSLRSSRDIFSRINSPMSRQSTRMLAHRS